MAELDPSFTFDLGGLGAQSQSPWEFAGALAQAEEAHAALTSIDDKIGRRMAGQKGGRRGDRGAAASDTDSDSDAPLPGEDSDGDEEIEGESESEEEAEAAALSRPARGAAAAAAVSDDEEDVSDEEFDESEEEDMVTRAAAAAAARRAAAPAQPRSEPGEAAARARRAAADRDEDDSGEEEEEEARPLPPAKRQRPGQEEKKPADRKGDKAGKDRLAEKKGAANASTSGGEAAAQTRGGGGFYDAAPASTSFSAQSFSDLHLSRPLVKACGALGYGRPTPIQAACIPLALAGRDVCGSAITGSGKTAAYALPLLERLLLRNKRVSATYVLVLAPVRELAVQVHSMIGKLSQFTDIRSALVVGGLSLTVQAAALRERPEIVVGTPGRLIDHVRNTQSVGLEDLQALVLDEADRLLEMGFAAEIREIVRMAPTQRQTLLFSATMTEEVKRLVALSLRSPVRLAADATSAAPKKLVHEIVRLKGAAVAQREALLLALASNSFQEGHAIVFCATKQQAHRLKILCGLAGLPPAAELHGDMTQAARLASLEAFRTGAAAFLLATDVAARGLDVLGVQTVINYDAPSSLDTYIHRVGRTARAGAKGRAVTFVTDDDRALVKAVVKGTGVQLQQRVVAPAAVAAWQARVEGMEDDVRGIIHEERDERHIRKAEMEAQKAANMLEHEAEIYARPPRTWFQSGKEKKAEADAAREAADDRALAGAAVSKAAKEKRRAELKLRAAAEAKAAKRVNALMDETVGVSRNIRAIKSKERELRESGMASGKNRRAAAFAVVAPPTKKKRKAPGALFAGDGLGGSAPPTDSRVYAGGARSGAVKVPRGGAAKSKVDLARAKRGGSVKGFKSKAKHKRR